MIRPYYEDTKSGIVIYHGDCREIIPQLTDIDVVITDPAYGIGFAAQPTKYQRYKGHKGKTWDDRSSDISVLTDYLGTTPTAIWGGNYFSLPISRGWLVWYKPDAPPSMGSIEMCWTNQDMNSRQISCSISQTNVERVGHPTQKPMKVMTWTIQNLPFGETILDPFMGSGTTLRAAKDLGRKAIGIEICEEYCSIAAKRLAQEVLCFT